MSERSIAIFAPARLQSERLPNKQILPLGNSCMFEICCWKLNLIAKETSIPTYVLIRDEELIKIAERFKNVKIILRDEETTKVDGPLTFIYKDIEVIPTTHLMFLNPCLTLLSPKTIERACVNFIRSCYNYGTSVKPFTNWIFNNQGIPITPIDYRTLSTKDVKDLYQAAHAFHIFDKDQFFIDGQMLKKGHLLLPVPETETMDIDTEEDYLYAKYKWQDLEIRI